MLASFFSEVRERLYSDKEINRDERREREGGGGMIDDEEISKQIGSEIRWGSRERVRVKIRDGCQKRNFKQVSHQGLRIELIFGGWFLITAPFRISAHRCRSVNLGIRRKQSLVKRILAGERRSDRGMQS